MRFKFKALALCGMLASLAVSSQGAPFASQISVANTDVIVGVGTTINYFLNEPADSVLVELVDGGGAVGASFAGTTARGENSLNWNGTVNNSTGAGAPAGTWRVRITATKNALAWSEIASNRSVANAAPRGTTYMEYFSGFSPNDCVFVTDQDSDKFGMGLVDVSYSSPVAVGVVPIKPDTSTWDGTDGYASRIFKSTVLESAAGNGSLWGMCKDPDNSNIIYLSGQHSGSTNKLWRGDLTDPASITRADPDGRLSSQAPRACHIIKQGGVKYLYVCNDVEIVRVPLDPVTGNVSGPYTKMSNMITDRYSRGLDLDADGNLYWVAKQTSSGAGGVLLRWDASLVQSGMQLLEANATWKITYPSTMLNMMGPAITPNGDVYVAMLAGSATGKVTGIFYVGNKSQASVVKSLAVEDRVVDFTQVGDPAIQWVTGTVYFALRSDPAGNLVAIDRTTEQVRVFGPAGNNSMAVTAPPSQTITLTSGIDSWSLY